MNKVLGKYLLQQPAGGLLLLLTALVGGCGKGPGNDPSGNPPGKNKPAIHSFSPGHGTAGAEVTINGKHFSDNPLRNEVHFQDAAYEATVSQASTTQLIVKVPQDARTGKIIVRVGDLSDTSTTDFMVDPAVFTLVGFQPHQGPFGTIVTLEGTGFEDGMEVRINNLIAPIKRRTPTTVEVEIPVSTTLTSHKFSVKSGNTTRETSEPFTVTAAGPYAQWENKGIVLSTNGTLLYEGGISFVHNNRIYWGFTRSTSGSNVATYVVFDPADPAKGWQSQPPPPANFVPSDWQSGAAIVHNDHIYIGSGITAWGESSHWWEFHPATNTGTALTDFPHAVLKPVAFSLEDKLYIGFGSDNKQLYQFDPAANNQKGSFTPAATGTFSDLSAGNAFVIDKEVYLGRALPDIFGVRKAVYKFTPPSQLVRVADTPDEMPALSTPSFTIGKKGYFVLNRNVWEYTPSATGGTWRAVIADTNVPVMQHTARLIIQGKEVIYGWSGTGRLYEFRFN